MMSNLIGFIARGLLFLALGGFSVGETHAATFSFFNFDDSEEIEESVFDLINRERKRAKLSEFEWDERLARVARRYSKHMAREGYLGHFDRQGNSVAERVTDEKITEWKKVGENLFFCDGYDDVAAIAVKSWIRSADHKRNMLDRAYTRTGIGVAKSRSGGYYVTQVFLLP